MVRGGRSAWRPPGGRTGLARPASWHSPHLGGQGGPGPDGETGRRSPTIACRRHTPSFTRAFGEQPGQAIHEHRPALVVLGGKVLLVADGPGEQLEAGLDDPQAGAFAFTDERELDQCGVAGRRLRAGRVIPAERETGRWPYCLHDEGQGPILEAHEATPTRFQLPLYPVGEPAPVLFCLGDRAPDDLDRSIDHDLPLDLELGHRRWSSWLVHARHATKGSTSVAKVQP